MINPCGVLRDWYVVAASRSLPTEHSPPSTTVVAAIRAAILWGELLIRFFSFIWQLIHTSVVDTTVLFPHRLGLPHRRSLKSLVADHLQRIIQDNGKSLFAYDYYQDPKFDSSEQTMGFMVKALLPEMPKFFFMDSLLAWRTLTHLLM